MQPNPDPVFGATTPVPMETSRGQKSGAVNSPVQALWGRKYVPPSPAEQAAARGPKPFPKMMYHPDGRMQLAEAERDFKEAKENGWKEQPELSHREMLQAGDGGKSGKRLPTAGSPGSDPGTPFKEPPKWGSAAIATTTKVTEQHVKFMKSRGYSVGTMADVEAFLEKLTTEEAAAFFADASEWKS